MTLGLITRHTPCATLFEKEGLKSVPTTGAGVPAHNYSLDVRQHILSSIHYSSKRHGCRFISVSVALNFNRNAHFDKAGEKLAFHIAFPV